MGPPLGGALTEFVSWRWNWWINLPACGLSFLILCFFLHVHNPRTDLFRGAKAIDWLGTISILGLSVMILLGLNLGGVVSPWASPKVICLIVFGLLVGIVFVFYEAKVATSPLMPMHILRRRSSVASLLLCFMHGFVSLKIQFAETNTNVNQVNVSSWYFLPLYFQAVRGTSPLYSGLLILPITVFQSIVGLFAGFLISYTGRYLELIWVGMTLTCLGFGLFITLSISTSLAKIVIIEIVAGLGVGLVFQPALIAFQSLVEQNDIATATALFGFVRSLSTAVSVVVGGVVFQNRMQAQYEHLLSVLPSNVAQMFSADVAAANVPLIGTLTAAQSTVVKESYARSLSSMWIMYCSTAALGLLISMLISREQLSTEHVETRTGLDKPESGGVRMAVR
jgi:MFS family permease